MAQMNCENCESSKKELNDVRTKLNEMQSLAKRIVQTDLFLRKYADKEKECSEYKDQLRSKERELEAISSKQQSIVKENEAFKKRIDELLKKLNQDEQTEKSLNEKLKSSAQSHEVKVKELNKTLEAKNARIEELQNENAEVKRLKTVEHEEFMKLKSESSKRISELEFLLKESLLRVDSSRLISSIDEGLNRLMDTTVTASSAGSESQVAEPAPPKSPEKTTPSPKVRFSLGSDDDEEEDEAAESVPVKKEDPFDFNLSSSDSEDDKDKKPSELPSADSLAPLRAETKEKGSAESVVQAKVVRAELSSEDSSDSSSSSSSSSGSSSSSSSASSSRSNSPAPVTKKPLATQEPSFSFDVSESEDEAEKTSTQEQEKLEKAKLELERAEKAKRDEEARKAEMERAEQERAERERSERERLEKEKEAKRLEQERLEREKEQSRLEKERQDAERQKVDLWVNQNITTVLDSLLADFMEETLTMMSKETLMVDFIVEKLINETINPPASLLLTPTKRTYGNRSKPAVDASSIKSIVQQVVNEEREELRIGLANEIVERLVDDTVNSWMQECCERVITEYKIEICASLRDELVEEHVSQAVMRSIILDAILEEYTLQPVIPVPESVTSPEKFMSKPKEEKPSKPGAARPTAPAATRKDISPAGKLTTPVKRQRTASKSDTPAAAASEEKDEAKRTRMGSFRSDEAESTKSDESRTRQSSPEAFAMSKMLQRAPHFRHGRSGRVSDFENDLKLCLADYFKKFNLRTAETFDEINGCIGLIADQIFTYNCSDESDDPIQTNSLVFSNLIVRHFLNNKFVPLNAERLAKQEDEELNLFLEVQNELNEMDQLSSIPQMSVQAESRERILRAKSNNLNFKTSWLYSNLKVKITNEEEKYVQLLKKLHDYPRLNEFLPGLILDRLKIALLSADFNDAYNYRLARLICFICREHKNYEYLNALILDLISVKEAVMPDSYHETVLLFIRIWPEVLSYPCSSLIYLNESRLRPLNNQRKYNPILCVIVDMVRRKFDDHYKRVLLGRNKPSRPFEVDRIESRLKYAFYTMETLCSWVFSFKSSEDTVKHLRDEISQRMIVNKEDNVFVFNESEFKLTTTMFEYLQAFKLVCINEGWSWTINEFLKNILKSILTELSDETSKKSGMAADFIRLKHVLAFYVLVQGHVTAELCPRSDSAGATVAELIASYDSLLFNSNQIKQNLVMDCAIVELLMLLGPLSPEECMRRIDRWLIKCRGEHYKLRLFFKLPRSLETKINYLYAELRNRLPSDVVISI